MTGNKNVNVGLINRLLAIKYKSKYGNNTCIGG